MGELISLIESAAFTIIGGLVAGVVGYFATIISLREQRKQRHLKEHKSNLKSVSKVLDQISADVWMFVYGDDNLKLPKPPFGNEKWVAKVEIKKEPIAMNLPATFSEYSHVVQVGINTALYEYISSHFQSLSRLLHLTEREVRANGTRVLSLLNSLSSLIYENMNKSKIDFPYWDGNKTVFKKFWELKNEVFETDFAGSVFLMVLGEDEDNWPTKVGWLKNNHVYDELKKLADIVKMQFEDELDHLRVLHGRIFQLINETKNEIEKIDLTTRLKGRCRYL